MANNIDIVDGLSSATKLKSTESGGVHTVHHNVDASALPTGAATAALQVTADQIDDALRAAPLPVSGTVAVTGTVTAVGTFYQATQPVSGTVTAVLGATGGATPALIYSAASNNLTSLKTSAGTITSIAATNNHATNYAYLKIYNKASAPVVASDTPIAVYTLGPAGGGIVVTPPSGMNMSTGIAYAITGAATHTDATNTAVAQVVGCLTYH